MAETYVTVEFEKFPKIPRLFRECIITEKIDGSNAQIYITSSGDILTGSRKRWITPEDDNFGFARWAQDNKEELLKLGPGRHYDEWWGPGIQRGYGIAEKRFSLFNAGRWSALSIPECCSIVPLLYQGMFSTDAVERAIDMLRSQGSLAAPGFNNPEGVIVYMKASNTAFKVLLENDDKHKGEK